MSEEMEELPTSDEEPLLPSPASSGVTIVKPHRSIVVEPAVIILVLFGFPSNLMTNLYILRKISNDLAPKHGIEYILKGNKDTNPCTQNRSDPYFIFEQEVQQSAAQFNIYLTVATNVPAFFVSLFIGAYSDKVGRKYAIFPPLFSAFLNTICLTAVVGLDLDIRWMLLGGVVHGSGGYFTVFLMGCFAYIADMTEPDKRMFRVAVVQICVFGSIIFTPIGLGYVIEKVNFFYPFLAVCVGLFFDLLYVIYFIPETVRRDPNADNRFFTTKHLRETAKLFIVDNGTGRVWQLNLLMIVFVVIMLPNMDISLITLFETNEPLCWTSVTIGYYTVASVASSSAGGALTATLLKKCLPDQVIALIACITAFVANLYISFVKNTAMMFCGCLFAPLTFLLIPTIRAMMAKLATDSEQGAVFGAIASAEIVCTLVGTAIFNGIYGATLYISSGFVYVVIAAFYLLAALCLGVYLICLHLRKTQGIISPSQKVD